MSRTARRILMVWVAGVAASAAASSDVLYRQAPDAECGKDRQRLPLVIGHAQLDVSRVGPECVIRVGLERQYERQQKDRSRSYQLGWSGIFFSVMTSDHERISRSSGWRRFYVFPRRRSEIRIETGERPGEVVLKTAMGMTATLDTSSVELTRIAGLGLRKPLPVAGNTFADLHRDGGGWGVTHAPSDGLVLDVGWRMGGAVQSMRARSTLIDSQGARCDVLNSRLFKLREEGNDDVDLRFETDEAFFAFAVKACPKLNLPLQRSAQP